MQLPKPFEHPIQIGDVDCLVTLRVESFVPPSMGFFNPINGDGEGPHDGCLEFCVQSIRPDHEGSISFDISWVLSSLIFEESEYLCQACLEAIEDANQPDPDILREDRDERERLIREDGGWGDE